MFVTERSQSFVRLRATSSDMVVVVALETFESIYFNLPCFPVLNVSLMCVCFSQGNHTHGRLVEFDGFIRSSLLCIATVGNSYFVC